MIDNNSKEFIYRHIGPSENEQKSMLKDIGYDSLEDLMKNTVPEKILLKDELKIDEPLSENDALKLLIVSRYAFSSKPSHALTMSHSSRVMLITA